MEVFTLFANTNYTFLRLSTGGVRGNSIEESAAAAGILKHRDGLNISANSELKNSAATLHVKPHEPFIASNGGNVVGHGIRITRDGTTTDYRIIGQKDGMDYDTGVMEFYVLTLEIGQLV